MAVSVMIKIGRVMIMADGLSYDNRMTGLIMIMVGRVMIMAGWWIYDYDRLNYDYISSKLEPYCLLILNPKTSIQAIKSILKLFNNDDHIKPQSSIIMNVQYLIQPSVMIKRIQKEEKKEQEKE
ncbi:hypothetical protein ACTFIV_008983 [Dictyostelium citrinum]